MEELTKLISSVGFPIAVALWFMLVNHKDMEKMRKVIENNTLALKAIMRK